MKEKMTFQKYQEKLDEIFKGNYILKKFSSLNERVTVYHVCCGKEMTIIGNELTRARTRERYLQYCKNCRERTLSKKEIELRLKELTCDRLILVDGYTSTHNNANFKCKICSHVTSISPHSLFNNLKRNKNKDSFGCPKCSKKLKYNSEIFNKLVKEKTNNECILVSEYKNIETKVEIKHIKCKKTWKTTPNNFLNKEKGHLCPHCTRNIESKGVTKIKEVLDSLNILYEQEKSFPNLKNKRLLKLDFYLKNEKIIIEFDGSQHFLNRTSFKSESFNTICLRDNIKNNYFKNSEEYILFRIPYTKINDIENIVRLIVKRNYSKLISYNVLILNKNISINEKSYYFELNESHPLYSPVIK